MGAHGYALPMIPVTVSQGTQREESYELVTTLVRTLSNSPETRGVPGSVYWETASELYMRFSGMHRPFRFGRQSGIMPVENALAIADVLLRRLEEVGIDPPDEMMELVQAALSRVPDTKEQVEIPSRLAAYLLLMAARNHQK